MNPALVTRVQRVGNARPLVNTVHSSFITFGVVLGSALGGLGLDRFGLRAPLWLGAALAVTGLLTLVPDLLRRTQRLTRPRTASDGTDTTSWPPGAPDTHPTPPRINTIAASRPTVERRTGSLPGVHDFRHDHLVHDLLTTSEGPEPP